MSRRRLAPDARIAAAALAFVIALVSMPMLSGWLISDSHCAITMDICHPVQAVEVGHAQLSAPIPQPFSTADALDGVVLVITDDYSTRNGRLNEAPALPPPQAIA